MNGVGLVTAEDLAAALESTVSGTKVTVFTSSGTFTPDANMLECEVWAWGGGGAGGGAAATAAGQTSVAGGGHGGAFAMARLTAAQIGASKAVTIGAGGTGVNGGTGGTGGTTTLGALVSAVGGAGGATSGAVAAGTTLHGNMSSTIAQAAVGDVRGWTVPGSRGSALGATLEPGSGGSTIWGGAGLGPVITAGVGVGGVAAKANTGSGGSGSGNFNAASVAQTGGVGGSGILIVKEYLHP